MKKVVFIFSVILLFINYLSAQDVKFTAQVTNIVEVGEQFRLIFSVNAKGTDLRMPPLTDFNVLSGPSTSSSTSMQVINGQVSQSSNFSYTYILQGIKTGKFTIGSATITVNGKQYKSNAVTVDVVKGSGAGVQSQQQNNQGQNQNQQGNKGTANTATADFKADELFVRVNVDKTNVYRGEPLMATIKVYAKVNLAGFENMKFPSFKGFFSQEMETPSNVNLQRENVNGQIYNVGLLKRVVLYPQKSGELIIEPFELECVVRQQVRNKNFWDDFFGSYQNVKKKVVSPQVKINVKQLPGNAPESFSGAVGKFNMTANINTKRVKTNDGITLKISISGSGNLKLVDTLNMKLPTDFERYDPKISNNYKSTAEGASGSKTFEYLIIPRHSGDFIIPPIEFTWFDLGSKQFKTVSSEEFKIHVDKGNEEENATVVSGMTKEDVKFIGSDVRFIKKNKFELKKKGELFFGSWLFILSYVLLLAIFIALYIVMQEKIRQNANMVLVKNKKANKISRKRLKTAAQFLKQNDKGQFYNEILKALWGYLSDKLSIPVVALSRDTVNGHLQKHNINQEIIAKVMVLIENCEYAHFAPSSEAFQMDKIYNEASDIIGELENKLR